MLRDLTSNGIPTGFQQSKKPREMFTHSTKKRCKDRHGQTSSAVRVCRLFLARAQQEQTQGFPEGTPQGMVYRGLSLIPY